MDIEPIKVLLIEDNIGDYELILQMLEKSENAKFELIHTPRLSQWIESS